MSIDTALAIRPLPESSRALLRGETRGGESSPPPPAQAPATPNPRMRLDGSLGVVVIEFRNQVGDVANTIPSPRQLQAYRAAVFTSAPLPAGLPLPGGPEAGAGAKSTEANPLAPEAAPAPATAE